MAFWAAVTASSYVQPPATYVACKTSLHISQTTHFCQGPSPAEQTGGLGSGFGSNGWSLESLQETMVVLYVLSQSVSQAFVPAVSVWLPQNRAAPVFEHRHQQVLESFLPQPPLNTELHPAAPSAKTNPRTARKARDCLILMELVMTVPQRTVVQEMN